MNNVIPARFDPGFRAWVFTHLKQNGSPKLTIELLLWHGCHPSFTKALVKSIIKKEGLKWT